MGSCSCATPAARSFVATTSGITGEDVRALMVAAVEHRFGPVNRLPVEIEWLTDNGSCYLARETRRFARDVGLVPCTTPLESPQSNGMAEAFVRTLKRDYVRLSPVPDAESVLRQLPGWLAHYNEVHPHRALGYRSPASSSPDQPQRACPGIKGQQHPRIWLTLQVGFGSLFALSRLSRPMRRDSDAVQKVRLGSCRRMPA